MSDVHLREVVDADLPILFEQQLDPDANRMAAFTSPIRPTVMRSSSACGASAPAKV